MNIEIKCDLCNKVIGIEDINMIKKEDVWLDVWETCTDCKPILEKMLKNKWDRVHLMLNDN